MPKLLQEGQVIADVENFRMGTVDAGGPARGCTFTLSSRTSFDINRGPHELDVGDGRVRGIMVTDALWPSGEITAVFNPQPGGL
ncbi:hypothetical protein DRW03_36055 [Corallococcus sp. H22C18031201]|nr:hypothetical protein DRW03_36055 [Corallococcus sp. H22C18031201]